MCRGIFFLQYLTLQVKLDLSSPATLPFTSVFAFRPYKKHKGTKQQSLSLTSLCYVHCSGKKNALLYNELHRVLGKIQIDWS